MFHVYKSFSLNRPSEPIQSISRFVRLSVRVSVCLSVCVFTFEVPFKRLFAPTSRSRMSNIFRASETLGKSNGKKWSHIWTFLFENCQKWSRKKSFFFADFAGLFQWGGYITTWAVILRYEAVILVWCGFWGILGPPSYGSGATIRIDREIQCLPYAGFLLIVV